MMMIMMMTTTTTTMSVMMMVIKKTTHVQTSPGPQSVMEQGSITQSAMLQSKPNSIPPRSKAEA